MNRKNILWRALQMCAIATVLIALSACGTSSSEVATSTPVVIVVTATSAPATNTAAVVVVTATPEPLSNTPTSQAIPTSTTVMTSAPPADTAVVPTTPSPITAGAGISYPGIVYTYRATSPDGRRQYLDSLKGQRVADWQGWIDVARQQFTTGKWEVKIDMDDADPNSSSWDVRIIVSEAQASQFSRGEPVFFSGTITEVSCGSTDCDVDIENATFSSGPTGIVQDATPVPVTSALPSPAVIDTPAPPVPTDTLAPPPPTSTPLGPEASIEAGIRKYARSAELQSVEYAGTSVNIIFKVRDNLFLKDATMKEVADILRGASEGAPTSYTQVWIRGMFPLKDDFGNVKDGQVLNLRYDRPTIERINWEGFTWRSIYKVADKAIIHPDLQP